MSRIRSVHPGFFTDEAIVTLSDSAQLFLIGLFTEADDQGVFEWKPITLKMKLRPASLEPVDGLLSELEAADRVHRYEVGGRHLGAIRNFRKYQRPKSPRATHVLPPEFRTYVGLSEPISEMQTDEHPPDGENRPQREDGGKGKEGGKEDSQPPPSTLPRGKSAAAQGFAFEGKVIRLQRRDFENWQKAYAFITDWPAEMTTIDAKLVDDPPAGGKWFGQVSGWLRAKNEKLRAAAKTANGARSPTAPVRMVHDDAAHELDELAERQRAQTGSDRRDCAGHPAQLRDRDDERHG